MGDATAEYSVHGQITQVSKRGGQDSEPWSGASQAPGAPATNPQTGVLRTQGQAAWGRLSPARRRRGESSSVPWGREPLFRALITRERFPRAFRGALGREASALEGAAA